VGGGGRRRRRRRREEEEEEEEDGRPFPSHIGVRLCDGHHFPLEHMANAGRRRSRLARRCASEQDQRVFGSASITPRTSDGPSGYTDLEALMLPRHLVANCTCNGRGRARFKRPSRRTKRSECGRATSLPEGLASWPIPGAARAQAFDRSMRPRSRRAYRELRARRLTGDRRRAAEEEPGVSRRARRDTQADVRGQVTRIANSLMRQSTGDDVSPGEFISMPAPGWTSCGRPSRDGPAIMKSAAGSAGTVSFG